jgi:hypothetical protein
MMWNWMVSALALGTTLVLYDGSPLHPHPGALWDLVIKLLSMLGADAAKLNVPHNNIRRKNIGSVSIDDLLFTPG